MSYIPTPPFIVIPRAEDTPVVVFNQANQVNNLRCNNRTSAHYPVLKYLLTPQQSPYADTTNPQTLLNRPISIIDSNKTFLNNRDTRETEAAEALVMLQNCSTPQLENRQQIAKSNHDNQSKALNSATNTSQTQVTLRLGNTKVEYNKLDNLKYHTEQSFKEIYDIFRKKELKIPNRLKAFESRINTTLLNTLTQIKKCKLDIKKFFENLILFYEFNAEKEQKLSLNLAFIFVHKLVTSLNYRLMWNNITYFASLSDDQVKNFLEYKNIRSVIYVADDINNCFSEFTISFEKINFHENNKNILTHYNSEISREIQKKEIKNLFTTQIAEILNICKAKQIELNYPINYILDLMIKHNNKYTYTKFNFIFTKIIELLQKIPKINDIYNTGMLLGVIKHKVNLDNVEKILGCNKLDNYASTPCVYINQVQVTTKQIKCSVKQKDLLDKIKTTFENIDIFLEKEKLHKPKYLQELTNKIFLSTDAIFVGTKRFNININNFFDNLILYYTHNAKKEQQRSLSIVPMFIYAYGVESNRFRWGNIAYFADLSDYQVKNMLENEDTFNLIHKASTESDATISFETTNSQNNFNDTRNSSKKRKASIDIDDQPDQPKRIKYQTTDNHKRNLV